MKRLVLCVLLLVMAGCSGIRPTTEQAMQLQSQAASVKALNDACQAGSIVDCYDAIKEAHSFMLVLQAVEMNPDWARDVKFSVAATAQGMVRCQNNDALCAPLADVYTADVNDYMREAKAQ